MRENTSHITMFFLSGFNETVDYRFSLFSLTVLCYSTILLLNVSLILIITWDKSLHEPMYLLLCSSCLNGLYGTAGFYPKFLWDLLSSAHVVSYAGCLFQALVMYSFVCSDLSILAVMAYDRYLAICRPLQYRAVMSKQRLFGLVCFSWMTPFCVIGMNILLTSRLKLCSSIIARLFCVNWTIVELACFPSDTVIISVSAYITVFFYTCHGYYIIVSYVYLIKTCISSIENRAKFMQTCIPHLLSLLIFGATILFDLMQLRFRSVSLPQTLQTFIEIQFLVIPPFINPLIYGFKLTKIRNKIVCFLTFKMK